MSLNFIVDCLEKGHTPKVLLEPQWMTDIEESCKFGDFFELMKPDTCGEENSITVKLGHKKRKIRTRDLLLQQGWTRS